MNILVSGACGVTSRAVVRSLRMSAHFSAARIIGTDFCKNEYGVIEHLCDKYYRLSHVEAEGYDQAVAEIIRREKIEAAIILTEKETLHWAGRQYPVKYLVPPAKFSKIAISKHLIHQALTPLGLVPKFCVFSSKQTDRSLVADFLQDHGQAWVRLIGEGSTSAVGALLIKNYDQLIAWLLLNPGGHEFMMSAYLPGRNFACCLLYHQGKLVKYAVYERLEYFMAHLVPSGISGNITRGKLINDRQVLDVSVRAVEHLATMTAEEMTGLVTVDLKGDARNYPNITEINLRHTAATSAFAAGGANMAEAQLLTILGRVNEIGPVETPFPPDNLILRDIDGLPLWLPNAPEVLRQQIHEV